VKSAIQYIPSVTLATINGWQHLPILLTNGITLNSCYIHDCRTWYDKRLKQHNMAVCGVPDNRLTILIQTTQERCKLYDNKLKTKERKLQTITLIYQTSLSYLCLLYEHFKLNEQLTVNNWLLFHYKYYL